MKRQKTIQFNFFMNIILSMSTFIFQFVTFPYVTRVLGPENLGKVSFAISVIAYFLLFSQLGIPTYGIRACAGVRDDRKKLSIVVHELFLINMITSVICLSLLFFLIMICPTFRGEKYLYVVLSSNILLSAIGLEWLFKGIEDYEYITKRTIIFKILAIVLLLLFVRSEEDYIRYAILTIVASSGSYIFNLFYARKFIDYKYLGPYNLKKHLKSVFVFFAMSCATTIYTNLDTVMLGLRKSDIEVGFYNTAIKVKSFLMSIVTSLSTVLLPRASYYIKNNKKADFDNIAKKAIEFVFKISLPLVVFFIFLAKPTILIIAGKEYINSILPMQIIMPTVAIIGITNVLGVQILIPLGKEKKVLYSEIIGAIIDFALNLVLMEYYSTVGVAIATLIAEIFVLIVQLYSLDNTFLKSVFGFKIYSTVISCLLALLSILWIPKIFNGFFIQIILSVIIYFFVYIITNLIFKDSLFITVINKIWKGKGWKI